MPNTPYDLENEARKQALLTLIECAKRRALMSDSEVAARITAISMGPSDPRLWTLLSELSVEETRAGREMISALVVRKHRNAKPGPGFFKLAKTLGRDTSDKAACWMKEVKKIHDRWAGRLDSKAPAQKAHSVGRMAKTLSKAFLKMTDRHWEFASFEGPNGGETPGIVDYIAIRRRYLDNLPIPFKAWDFLDVIFVQSKGGGAKAPLQDHKSRLIRVARHHGARAMCVSWKQKSRGDKMAYSLWHKNKWRDIRLSDLDHLLAEAPHPTR